MTFVFLGRRRPIATVYPLLLLIFALPALASYDPQHPPSTENFDPAEANPAGRIYCYGSPNVEIDQGFLPFNPNTQSLQRLCPKPQYSGFAGPHAGAYCLGQGAIAFDHSEGARVSDTLTNPRFLLQCQQRCFCSTWKPWEHKGPKPIEYDGLHDLSTYQIKADLVDDWDHYYGEPQRVSGGIKAHTLTIAKIDEVTLRQEQRDFPETPVLQPWYLEYQNYQEERPTIDLNNHVISCADGPLPGPLAFMPTPMQVADYPYERENNEPPSNAIYSICVNALDGGSPQANAGGYCPRVPLDDEAPGLRFSDELVPRFDWTFQGNHVNFVMALRYFCSRSCVCRLSKKATGTGIGYMVQNNYVVEEESDGSINIKMRSSGDVIAQVFPPQRNTLSGSTFKPHAGKCGPQHDSFCPMTWPKQLGPIPKGAYLAEKAVSNGPGKEKNTQCGGKCDGPKQCAASAQGGSCVCAFPGPKDAQTLGLDPFFPPAVCLYVAAAFTLSAGSELSGRSRATMSYLDSDGNPLNCLCNATFASHACCGPDEKDMAQGTKPVQLKIGNGTRE